MSNLIPFNYQEKEVRTILKESEPWFNLKDVCEILEVSNSADVFKKLDDDEKGVESFDTLGGSQKMNCVNESGLYSVIMTSYKPEAKLFKRWITHEVIPSIRKHGLYATEELLNNPDLAIKAFTALKEEREKNKLLATENKLLTGTVLKWADRKILEAIVKQYGSKLGGSEGFQEAWREFKKELLYQHSINLNARITNYLNETGKRTKPKTMSMIHDEEMSKCISTAVALCKAKRVDISAILTKYAA